MGSVACLILLDEADELRALALDRLARLVEQCDDEVEEVALPQVRRRLLLVVCAPDAAPSQDSTRTVLCSVLNVWRHSKSALCFKCLQNNTNVQYYDSTVLYSYESECIEVPSVSERRERQ